MGFNCIGHSIWIFNATPDVLTAGCRGADVLITDSACLASLPSDWTAQARGAMQNAQIYVHDRDSYKLNRLE